MADIATLGLAIDSSQAVTAKTNLDRLTVAAVSTSSATSQLQTAAQGSSSAISVATVAVKAHGSAHAGLSGQAQASMHSIRSAVEQIAMGVQPTQILTQQIGHLSYAAS